MTAKKIVWACWILFCGTRITDMCTLAEDNTNLILRHYASGQPFRELKQE